MKDATKELIEQKNIRRNKQLAQLMIENPCFLEAISEWREKLDIPEGGFADCKNYCAYLRRKEKEFKNRKLDIIVNYDSRNDTNYQRYFRNEVQMILQATHFLHNMEEVTEYYLCFNKLPEEDAYYLKLPYGIDFPEDFSAPWTRLGIVIDDSTTIEEIKAAWPEIMEHQRYRKIIMNIKQTRKNDPDYTTEVPDDYIRKPQFRSSSTVAKK